MTKTEIKNWLSAHRKWAAWGKWMSKTDDPISSRTLRRGLDEREPTPRQMKAIEAAKVYISQHTTNSFQPSPMMANA